MHPDIVVYHSMLNPTERAICELLHHEISAALPQAESKLWHRHPVWFLDGNPTVGYSSLRKRLRLMFWSGADFTSPGLTPGTGKFKDASITYQQTDEVDVAQLSHWLEESQRIQWDYKNLVKRQGRLERLT